MRVAVALCFIGVSAALFVRALSELAPASSSAAPHVGWVPVANAPRLDQDGSNHAGSPTLD